MRSQNEYTKEERTRISVALEKKLGPEYISYRTGWNNAKLMYVEGWLVFCLANKIFGFDGWSSEIKNMNIDYEENCNSKWSVGITCTARIILRDGTTREDVGFGSAENQRNRGMALEKARKEAATDALKRALRQFGNALGNCCYDKEYIREIQGVKRQETNKIDVNKLLRKNEGLYDNNSFEMEQYDVNLED